MEGVWRQRHEWNMQQRATFHSTEGRRVVALSIIQLENITVTITPWLVAKSHLPTNLPPFPCCRLNLSQLRWCWQYHVQYTVLPSEKHYVSLKQQLSYIIGVLTDNVSFNCLSWLIEATVRAETKHDVTHRDDKIQFQFNSLDLYSANCLRLRALKNTFIDRKIQLVTLCI